MTESKNILVEEYKMLLHLWLPKLYTEGATDLLWSWLMHSHQQTQIRMEISDWAW